MEDDDDFGELYADVLPPIHASSTSAPPLPLPFFTSSPIRRPDSQIRADDDNFEGGDENGILLDASRADHSAEIPSVSNQALAPPAAAVAEDDWMLGHAAPAVEPPEKWDEEEDAVSSRPAEVRVPDVPGEGEPRVLEDEEEEYGVSAIPDGDCEFRKGDRFEAPEQDGYPLFGGGRNGNLGDLDEAPVIPGLSAGPSSSVPFLGMNIEEGEPSRSENLDSDSEDDLQIVLNDSDHGPFGGERNDGIGIDDDNDDDDREEDLVIVTDKDQHRHLPVMEEQDWGEEAMQPTGDGERKEMEDLAKVSGATGPAPGLWIGYSNHGFNTQHHTMCKYTRPGATPLPGAGTVGPPGATRPPVLAPIAGRGRGDWRPAGSKGIPSAPKSYHTGFGFPTRSNSSARAFGSGLDFALPAQKTVFDVGIESFEEKPWRHPGVDISNFFNFGLDEDKWKNYCKQLDQLRLESTMKSKICVYESGRSEQAYDPDLPPELAAAAGNHDISADNGHGKSDNGGVDFTGREPAIVRAPLPTGRAIQVEGGYGERLPSIDTRHPRIRDSDVIIEIVLQDSFDDPKMYNCAPEQPEMDVEGDVSKGFHEKEKDERNMNCFLQTSINRNKEMNRTVPFAKEKDEVLSFPSASGIHQGERFPQGSSCSRHSNAREQSIDIIASQSAHSSRLGDQQKETLADSTEVNQSSQISLAVANGTAIELSVEDQYCGHDEKLALVNSTEIKGEDMTLNFHISSETSVDDNLVHPGNKQKLCSQVEQPAVDDSGYDDEVQTSNSDNTRENSGSSKDHPRQTENGNEVIREGHSSQMGYLKLLHKEDECNLWQKDEYSLDARQEREKNRIVSKGREDAPSSYQYTLRGRSYERRKESESSIGSWQRREDNLHSRRVKDEIWWENTDEMVSRHKNKLRANDRNQKEDHSRKHVEDEEWRGHRRDEIIRQREKDDLLMSRHENIDDPLVKRKRNEEYLRGKAENVDTLHGYRDREDSGQRKRERDDGLDHRRREVETRMKLKAEDHLSSKHGYRDREDSGQRKRERDDGLDHRRREVETRMMLKAEDHLSSKHKDGNWCHKEREDRPWLKPHENVVTRWEREEERGAVRNGRDTEDKPSGGNGRNRDELKTISYDKDYQTKERRRHNEHSRRDHTKEDILSQNKGHGEVSVREKHSNADERSSRHERLNTYGDHPPSTDDQQMYRERHRENRRKAKDAESHEQNNHGLGKRKHEDCHTAHQNEKVYIKVSNEQESNSIGSTTLSKDLHQIHEQHEVPQQHNSMRKQGEGDPVMNNENQGSRRGRSKLEHWTSHIERDDDVIVNTGTLFASSKTKKIEGDHVDVAQEAGELAKIEHNNAGELDVKGADVGQVVDKMVDDQGSHLDTMAKLKRRSERFRLPIPIEKEITSNKKWDNEVQLSNNEAAFDSKVKTERPARKRKWTGS